MPKLIPQTFFFGTPSVIFAQINSPKHFFPACIGFVDDGNATWRSKGGTLLEETGGILFREHPSKGRT